MAGTPITTSAAAASRLRPLAPGAGPEGGELDGDEPSRRLGARARRFAFRQHAALDVALDLVKLRPVERRLARRRRVPVLSFG